MKNRMIIYQVLPRLFGNTNNTNHENGSLQENGVGKMSAFDTKVLDQLRRMGVTHVWYTGIIRHATQTDYSAYGIPQSHPAVVKGKAGSPYSISDYYDVDPDIADNVGLRMNEFEELVDRTHRAKLKVLLDFVPNHVARQYYSIAKPAGVKDFGEDDDTRKAFSPKNNFYYCPNETFAPYIDLKAGSEISYYENPAKATGNDHFDAHPSKDDWYETVKLNYGVDYSAGGAKHFYPVPDTWNKMVDILMFWAGKGVDGFRCDMAEMVPVDFWHYATEKLREEYPELIFIGEVYNPNMYRDYAGWGGFDYLYDKVGVYDTLKAVVQGRRPATAITKAWQQTDDINSQMLYFLENHDEQRIASQFFAGDAMKIIPALAVSLYMRNNPFMLYMGQSFGEKAADKEGFSGADGRTSIFDYWCVPSLYRRATDSLRKSEKHLHSLYKKMIGIATKEKAITNGEFFDLMYVNPTSWDFNPEKQYAFLRKRGNDLLIICANFDNRDINVTIKIPEHAFEVLGIREGVFAGKELLGGATMDFELRKNGNVEFTIAPEYVSIWKLSL